jgi:hypothetical protein
MPQTPHQWWRAVKDCMCFYSIHVFLLFSQLAPLPRTPASFIQLQVEISECARLHVSLRFLEFPALTCYDFASIPLLLQLSLTFGPKRSHMKQVKPLVSISPPIVQGFGFRAVNQTHA